jgi:hypothetical protein
MQVLKETKQIRQLQISVEGYQIEFRNGAYETETGVRSEEG